SSPATMAWRPRGFLMRKSPWLAACSSRLTSLTEMCARSSVVLRTGAPACSAAIGWRAMATPAPDLGSGGAPVPPTRHDAPGQRCQRPEFRAEGNPVVGLRQHGGLAGDRIAQHRKTLARSDDERIKPVQCLERALQRCLQAVALAPSPGEKGGSDLAVVLSLEARTVAAQEIAPPIVG